MKHIKLFESFLDESVSNKFYLLTSDSVIDTKNPKDNEFVADWTNMSYILVDAGSKPFIMAGSGTLKYYEVEVGSTVVLLDDGNGTTRFGHGGKQGTVLAVAESPEEMTSDEFPVGKFKLLVMK